MITEYKQSNNFIGTTIIIIVIFFLLVAGWYLWGINSSSLVDQSKQLFVIQVGEPAQQISERLATKGLIDSQFLFEVYLRTRGLNSQLQAGDHYISSSLSIKQIAQTLTSASQSRENSITVIEGWNNQEIADYLEDQGIVSVNDFLAAANRQYNYDWLPLITKQNYLQGYLFPDTYRLYQDAGAEDIIEKMLDNFVIKVDENLRQAIRQQGKDLLTIITLASIVEKEVSGEADIKLVADIFWRRLQDRYPLQSDATVNYVTNKGLIQPSIADTKVDSPYNTYKYAGLPPGPIGNPSLASIVAVVYPLPNSYYFFLTTKDDGRVIYSRTYEEHLRNKAKYLD